MVRPLTEGEKLYFGAFGLGKNCKQIEDFSENVADNRTRLIEICTVRDMRAMNTYFEHGADKLATYRPTGISPGDEIRETTHEQIDYILVNSNEARVIRNVITDTTAPLMTDHYPLITDFRIVVHPTA